MTRPPPLPRPVPFSVYGLDAAFTGARNLVLWNQPDYLWNVTLTHGYPASGERITVTTARKKPAVHGGNGDSAAPMSLVDAAHDAIATAIDLTRGRSGGTTALWRRETDRVDVADVVDVVGGAVQLWDWTPTSLAVNGAPTPAFDRVIGSVRATVADVPDVVLSITASPDIDLTTVHLVDVRAHLDDHPWPTDTDI